MFRKIIAGAALAGSLALAGCAPQDAKTALAQAKSDIATVEQALATGSLAFCTALPALQANADIVLSMTTIDARTASEVAAGKAAAAVVCNNPTQTNIAALIAKTAAAKAAVNTALKAAK